MNIPYMMKRIGLLVILLLISAWAVLTHKVNLVAYTFLEAYFRFGLYVIGTGLAVRILCENLPRRFDVDKGFFSCHEWEEGGEFYDRKLKVKKWKGLMVDAGELFNAKSKSISTMRDPKALNFLIQDMCMAEASHWMLCIVSLGLLLVIHSDYRWLLWICTTGSNLLDIIIQRYNRPRIVKIYNRLCAMEKRSTASIQEAKSI